MNFICKVLEDGSIYGIFQKEGYYDKGTRTRVMLCEHYATEGEVDDLIAFGDISRLDRHVPTCLDSYPDYWLCKSVRDDRYYDGHDISPKKFNSFDDPELSRCHHIYFFGQDKKWRMYRKDTTTPKKERIRAAGFNTAKYYAAPVNKKTSQEISFEDLL